MLMLTAAAALPARIAAALSTAPAPDSFAMACHSFWRSRTAACFVGRLLLRAAPNADAGAILQELAAEVGAHQGLTSHALSVAEWHDRLADRVREDFREGRVCDVAGWMLSETEVLLLRLTARAG